MEMESSDGRTAVSTLDNGSEESSMVLASTETLKEKTAEVSGRTASASDGSTEAHTNIKALELIEPISTS